MYNFSILFVSSLWLENGVVGWGRSSHLGLCDDLRKENHSQQNNKKKPGFLSLRSAIPVLDHSSLGFYMREK